MSKEFKKLSFQYSYLKLEKDEVFEACASVEKEIRTYLKKISPDSDETEPKQNPPQPVESEIPEIEEDDEEEKPSAPPKNKDVKKLYRKIAEKTHPDKVGNNDLAEIFSKAAKAYSENDIATLLDLAGGLNIELSDLSTESILLLKNNIESIFNEIDIKKKTVAWAWYNSASEEEKVSLAKTILVSQGVNI